MTAPVRRQVETVIPVMVGRSGTKSHRLQVSVRWDDRKQDVAVYAGQTTCGSQRFGSGWYAISPDQPITCERCRVDPDEREGSYASRDRVVEHRFTRDPLRVFDGTRGLRAGGSLNRQLLPAIVEEVTPTGPCLDAEPSWPVDPETGFKVYTSTRCDQPVMPTHVHSYTLVQPKEA
jgi:hypothetical protein